MGIWSRLTAALNLGRTRPVDPSRAFGHIPIGWIPTGLRITTEEATNLSVVWACIQTISTAIASSPWNVFQVTNRTRLMRPEDPLAYLLNQRPNPEITAIAFRESMMFGALAYGNAYAEIQRDGAGRVAALVPLYPDRMICERSEDGQLQYRYANWDGGQVVLEPRNVYHLRGPVSVAGLMGDSIVGRAAKACALAAAAERFSLSYLANGTVPSGVLKYPQKLDPKSLERIREQWAEKMSGPKAGGKPVILEGGMEWVSISADPDRAQLIPTQHWTTENIGRYFGVPLVKLGVAAAAQGYGTNLESLNLEWKNAGLKPWALRLEQEANAKLLSAGPYRETALDMDWLVRGDAKSQAEADRVRIESGVYSVNEVRERIGANTIGAEGDIRFVNGTLAPLTTTLLDIQELAAKEPEPPSPAVSATEDGVEVDPEEVEDEDPGESPEGGSAVSAITRMAISTMFGEAFARMERRVASKARELGDQKITAVRRAELLNAFRGKAQARLVAECGPALSLVRRAAKEEGRHLNGEADLALLAAIEQLGKGQDVPDHVAQLLTTELLPEVST